MTPITFEALLERFDPAVHNDLRRIAAAPGTEFLVLYENQTLDSPHCGLRSAVAVGPNRTVTSLEAAYSRWLHDLPSQRQHPIAHCKCPISVSRSTSKTACSTTTKPPSASATISASD